MTNRSFVRQSGPIVGVAILLLVGSLAFAQQTTITTPMQSAGHSYFEQFGVNWGFSTGGRGGGMFFNNGGGAVPPFGGFDPAAGANIGFGANSGNGNFFLGVSAGQGSNTSSVSQSPSVTVMNGQIGTITDTVQTPFVTSFIPIVGEPVSPLHEKLDRLRQEGVSPRNSRHAAVSASADSNSIRYEQPSMTGGRQSSAARAPVASVAEIRRQQAREEAQEAKAKTDEIDSLIAKAHAAKQAGKSRLAQLYYQMAAKKSSGDQKVALEVLAKTSE